jgi:probable F420-dependent oxidoreductase
VTASDAFGAVGIWVSRGSLAPGELAPIAAAVEEAGFGALWISGGGAPGTFDAVDEALAATRRIPVATGVVNIWVESPEAATAAWQACEERFPGRFFLGMGVSHAPFVEAKGLGVYAKPLQKTREYLDALDAQPRAVPPGRRLLGALGPKMLEMARTRSLGSHPYLVVPENTVAAREVLGDAFLAVELGVVLDDDVDRGRATAREFLSLYLGFPNYTNNLRRAGYADDDLTDGGSDRLVNALFAIGGPSAVEERVEAHLGAGADHVCLQVIGPRTKALAETARELRSVARPD